MSDVLTQVEAVCLERWGAIPSSKEEIRYHIAGSSGFPTELNIAVSRLYENATYQSFSEEAKQQALQHLVWFVNDRWSWWQWSPYRDLIVDAVQQTDLVAELDYEYVIRIGDKTFINNKFLEERLFPADMFRVRNHLLDGEMVILIPKNGVIGVAHASREQRVLTIVDLPVEDSTLQQRYDELARQMKELADLEAQVEKLERAFFALQLTESPDLTGIEQADESTQDMPEPLEDEFSSLDHLLKTLGRMKIYLIT